MINTKRPLEEKIALFWHGILCTGHAKCENPKQQMQEVDMFRRLGMGNFEQLLLELARHAGVEGVVPAVVRPRS